MSIPSTATNPDTAEQASRVFLPWARLGAAAGIQTPDGLDARQAGAAALTVSLAVNDADVPPQSVRLYGPGDVVAIDPHQVVRTEPRHLASDFEPNYFPAVEFDRPDFPWLFTPAAAAADGKLRPWLCLVVVKKQPGVRVQAGQALPELVIEDPAQPRRELPELSDSWAWAHAQVTGRQRTDAALQAVLAADSTLTVSRLICPRRLDPATDYLACVVPAFELGRRAGLGLPIAVGDEKAPAENGIGLAPAWSSGAQAPAAVTLPIYYQWEFRTGDGSDFEQLVDVLTPRKLPPEVGKRPIDISDPGLGIIVAPGPDGEPGARLDMEGALRIVDSESAPWPDVARAAFQASLRDILNAPWEALKDGLDDDEEPLLAPPIYGCWQAAQHTVELPPETQPLARWLHELNLDPRQRVVAALGTRVVQANQEQLVAAAWEQMGEIARLNQLQRQAQLSRAVNDVYFARHFERFAGPALLNVASVAQSRLAMTSTARTAKAPSASAASAASLPVPQERMLLGRTIARSSLPDRTVSAPVRQLTSQRSALSARFRTSDAQPFELTDTLNTAGPDIVPLQRKNAGWMTIGELSRRESAGFEQIVRYQGITRALDSLWKLDNFRLTAEGDLEGLIAGLTDPVPPLPGQTERGPSTLFRRAARQHQDIIAKQIYGTIWQSFTTVFGGGSGILYGVDHLGRLFFYRGKMESGAKEVLIPRLIGLGGWLQFPFLFSGGGGVIYAVSSIGQLLRYRDKNQDGTGDVANPQVIGLGGWLQFKFLFAGSRGVIYAISPQGQLFRYLDDLKDTTIVKNPQLIAPSGWDKFTQVCADGDVIYAVDSAGRLLLARDETASGAAGVPPPTVISTSGWQNFRFVLAVGGGILHAVDQDGRLLITRDEAQDGTGSVALPVLVSPSSTTLPSAPLDMAATRSALLRSIDPQTTIKPRTFAVPSGARDPLEPILEEPEFPQPMYEALRDLGQDFLLPGLEHVPPNTVALLETNNRFVESFLVGLNAELSHELLWRGFPTDQRGTYFRSFWDRAEEPAQDSADIPRISTWGNRRLGENARGSGDLVLLLRGELLRRYPNTVIYAVRAVPGSSPRDPLQLSTRAADEIHPIFRGTLDPNVTFLGFPISQIDAIGGSGSKRGVFFVIQEQPTEPRFGLDAADFTKEPPAPLEQTWNDLNWRHLAATPEQLQAISHVSTAIRPLGRSEIDKVIWGRNGAHQALITLQRPVRIAIHAKDLLPPI